MTLHANVAIWVAKETLWEARLGDFDDVKDAEKALKKAVWAELFPGDPEIADWREKRIEIRWYDRDWQPADAPVRPAKAI